MKRDPQVVDVTVHYGGATPDCFPIMRRRKTART